MWESSGFKECVSDNLLVASDGWGGSRDTPKTLTQVALGVASFSMHILSETAAHRFLERPGARQTHGSTSRALGAILVLSRVDEKTSIQIPTDAKYVMRGVTHRSELEQGPNGTLWSIIFQLIDGRSGFTDVIKVKSHLEDVCPTAFKQNKIHLHHMLTNSLADVVAKEAAKRLLPDTDLERKAKKAERIGGVAKRLALVQSDILG